ncbi:MAG: hypothetical protein KDD04_06735, partial [Sinomicrobium sp.]|nr:hypothetical protein [Sinomicrobium sp.]
MKTKKIILPVFLMLLLMSCSKDNNIKNLPPRNFNLVTVADGAMEVDLLPTFFWNAATDPEGRPVTYTLYLDTIVNPVTVYAESITGTTYNVMEPLLTYTQYYWKVIAIDNVGNTTTSDSIYRFTTGSENSYPTNFDLIAVADNATAVDVFPVFSWEASTDPEGFPVTYSLLLDTNENPVTVHADGITDTFYEVTERLAMYENYHWNVVAEDPAGKATESSTYSFGTRGLNFPGSAVTENPAFIPRAGHTTAAFDNKLWVIGGNDPSPNNDVWYSEDGITWTEATPAANFSARAYHTTTVFQGELWVIGGFQQNDVWHSGDGIIWTEATASANFSGRSYHTTAVFQGELWVIGGNDGDFKNDVWHSEDGITWAEATPIAAFSARSGHTAAVFDGKLWVIGGVEAGGVNKNDVWY